jgi:hypothetical protein
MASQKPFFSIVIPTLNEEKYLPHLLSDLSSQTFRDFEVIIVDGHSNDQTLKLAKAYLKKLPKTTILTSPKRHVCVQRNLGAKHAQSKILVFMDADNRLDSYFLMGLRYRLESDPADFATCWVKSDGNTKSDAFIAYGMNVLTELSSIDTPMFSESLTIASTAAFNDIGGFDENNHFGESRPLIKSAHQKGYTFRIYRDPTYTFSFRRIRKFGIMNLLGTITKHELSHLTGKELTTEEIKQLYPMQGGSLFDEKINRMSKVRFIKNIDRALSNIKINQKPLTLKALRSQLKSMLEV